MAERRRHRATAHRVEVASAGGILQPHPLPFYDHRIAAVELREQDVCRGAVDELRTHADAFIAKGLDRAPYNSLDFSRNALLKTNPADEPSAPNVDLRTGD